MPPAFSFLYASLSFSIALETQREGKRERKGNAKERKGKSHPPVNHRLPFPSHLVIQTRVEEQIDEEQQEPVETLRLSFRSSKGSHEKRVKKVSKSKYSYSFFLSFLLSAQKKEQNQKESGSFCFVEQQVPRTFPSRYSLLLLHILPQQQQHLFQQRPFLLLLLIAFFSFPYLLIRRAKM